jgi:hypothetical protein
MTAQRRAYSLIECIVLITTLSIVLGLAGTLVHSLMNFDRADRRRIAASEMVERLGRTLRSDAHRSIAPPEIAPRGMTLKLGDGQSVVYQIEKARMIRTLQQKDKPTHRDIFTMPPRVSVRFEGRGGPKSFDAIAAVLTEVDEPGHPADGPYRDFSIEASLGRDRRLIQEPGR